MRRSSLGLAAVVLAFAATPAVAAPVTVNLRIEGPTRTLFEDAVTTDVRPFQFTGDPISHECDGTAANQGPSATPVPTRGAAVAAAAAQAPFSMTGTWFDSLGSPSFTQIAGENVAFDAATGQFLVEYLNSKASNLGACGEQIGSGDDVLFAYGAGTETLLKLSGPGTAAPGVPVALRVTNAADGSPVAGASVGGQTSGSDGAVSLGPFDTRGNHDLKAAKDGAIRSNRVTVCVTDGADGACGSGTGTAARPGCVTTGDDGNCGTKDRRAPRGKILSIREAQRFGKGRGPRALGGIVTSDPSGLGAARLRLTRNDGGRCQTFDGRRERMVALRRCGAKRGKWFSVGDREQWSYLLPARLGPGRYVLDLQARDRAGNVDTLLQRTRTRVVFRVS
jgi:hypothetical protein